MDDENARVGLRSRRGSMTIGTALLALALLAAACGERGPDPSFASDPSFAGGQADTPGGGSGDAASNGSGSVDTAPADTPDGSVDGSAEGAASSSDDAATENDPAMFGTLESPCGPGDASGATAQGVTDDTIKVGTIADPGFAGNPGLNQELFDAAVAFEAWCNAQGGILGRELLVEQRDAALFDYLVRIQEACESDFALVGGGGVFDDQGAQERVDCGLPEVAGFSVTPPAVEADLSWQSVPNPVYTIVMGHYVFVSEESPEIRDSVGLMFPNFGTTVVQKDRTVEALEQLGFTVVYEGGFNPNGEANWTPFVIAMREAGVELFTFVGARDQLGAVQQAMAEQDWQPTVTMLDASFYDASYAATNEAAEGSMMRVDIAPFEEAGLNPATQLYLDNLAAVGADEPALLGNRGTSAFLLFATAAKACGSELTRECLVDQLEQVTAWTGGGLHAESNPAANLQSECFAILEISDGGFVRHHPTEPGTFFCDPNDAVTLTGDYGEGAKVGG